MEAAAINTRLITVVKTTNGKNNRLPSEKNIFRWNSSLIFFIEPPMLPIVPPKTNTCRDSAAVAESIMPISTRMTRPKYFDNISGSALSIPNMS